MNLRSPREPKDLYFIMVATAVIMIIIFFVVITIGVLFQGCMDFGFRKKIKQVKIADTILIAEVEEEDQ